MNNLFLGLNLCSDLNAVWTIFGYVILAIQIITPLLLIISGSITLAQAVMKDNKEDDIKKAEKSLAFKALAAVSVFLVIFFTELVIGLVADGDWTKCVNCALHPMSGEGCGIKKANIETGE